MFVILKQGCWSPWAWMGLSLRTGIQTLRTGGHYFCAFYNFSQIRNLAKFKTHSFHLKMYKDLHTTALFEGMKRKKTFEFSGGHWLLFLPITDADQGKPKFHGECHWNQKLNPLELNYILHPQTPSQTLLCKNCFKEIHAVSSSVLPPLHLLSPKLFSVHAKRSKILHFCLHVLKSPLSV